MSMNAIIAINPQQMQEAQATTIGWVGAKLAEAQNELALAKQTFEALHVAGLRTKSAEHLAAKANRRIKFYEKLKAALEAGYHIIPPFNIQLFAVRTDRASLNDDSESRFSSEQRGRSLPVGVGRFENPAVTRFADREEERKNFDGTTRKVTIFRNGNWPDEIEMPIRALKPQVIEATGRALHEKIFDALGIAPAYRAADPIIAGQIYRPDGKGVITFFVAWWLDEGDL